MHGRICLLMMLWIAGCTDVPLEPVREPNTPKAPLRTAFDASTTGTIHGQVCWDGEVPTAKEYTAIAHSTNPYLFKSPARFTLPHYPKVSTNQGIEHAVVFLRSVDAERSKPWDHAPLRVEFKQRQLAILQGERRASVGFVQPGGVMEMVNRDAEYHHLSTRGAAFFADPLIIKDRVNRRTLAKPGIVDLSSGNGYYWLHAHLFVTEHPYYACTDANGQFRLDQVPAGTHELVCWMPSWHVKRKERDPESGTVTRVVWAPPVEQTRTIEVQAGQQAEVEYRWTIASFDPKN
jgi:hypothetical protein